MEEAKRFGIKLINFNDSTAHGKYILFRNLDLFGKITTVRDDYILSINLIGRVV